MNYVLGENSLNHPGFREGTVISHVAALIERNNGEPESVGILTNQWGERVKNSTITMSVQKAKSELGRVVKTRAVKGEIYIISRR